MAPADPFRWVWPLVFSASLSLAAQPAVSAPAPARCADAQTTLEIATCLDRLLQASDRELEQRLRAIATEATGVSSPEFRQAWQRFTAGLRKGGDPTQQFRAYQQQRRQICQYVNGLSLEGSGFGLFVLSCELDLNASLLQQWRQ